VEGQVGYVRRNYLTPVPRVATLEDLNQQIAAFEEHELGRRIGSRIRTIGQDFAREAPHLLPLPPEPSETAVTFRPRADRYSRITVKVCSYSVPVRFIDRKVTVHRPATHSSCSTTAARSPAMPGSPAAVWNLVLDHYLMANDFPVGPGGRIPDWAALSDADTPRQRRALLPCGVAAALVAVPALVAVCCSAELGPRHTDTHS
jgi:hypothetical protein